MNNLTDLLASFGNQNNTLTPNTDGTTNADQLKKLQMLMQLMGMQQQQPVQAQMPQNRSSIPVALATPASQQPHQGNDPYQMLIMRALMQQQLGSNPNSNVLMGQ